MIDDETRELLESTCRSLCDRFELTCVYFARILGPRRHYLAGWGEAVPDRPAQRALTEDLALFWQGDWSTDAQDSVRAELAAVVERVQAQWSRPRGARRLEALERPSEE